MADFQFFLNRQGPRGPQGYKGDKGDDGKTPVPRTGTNTPIKTTVIFDTGDGNTYETPNLKYLIEDRGGNVVMLDRTNETQYYGTPDQATDDSYGIVKLATSESILNDPLDNDVITYELFDNNNQSIKSVTDSLTGDITQLQTDLGTEVTNRTNADTQLTNKINTDVGNEATARSNADTALSGRIDGLNSSKANKSDVYTKTQTDSLLTSKSNVGHTHNYNDLTNKPTIGNGTITLTQGGVTKGTFTTNQTGNSTIDLDAGGGSNLTAGNAINISDNTISVKYDGTTIGLNASGQLQSLVEEPDMTQYYTKSQVDNLIPGYATTQTAGLVKVGNNLSIAADGTLSADTQAPTAGSGISVNGTAVSVNVDNSTITINNDGQLTANIPTPETVDQTYDATSAHAQSGVAIAGAGFLNGSIVQSPLQYLPDTTDSLTYQNVNTSTMIGSGYGIYMNGGELKLYDGSGTEENLRNNIDLVEIVNKNTAYTYFETELTNGINFISKMNDSSSGKYAYMLGHYSNEAFIPDALIWNSSSYMNFYFFSTDAFYDKTSPTTIEGFYQSGIILTLISDGTNAATRTIANTESEILQSVTHIRILPYANSDTTITLSDIKVVNPVLTSPVSSNNINTTFDNGTNIFDAHPESLSLKYDSTTLGINASNELYALSSTPSNMVTTDTQQIITGRKDMAIINIQPSGSTGYLNYITPISSGRIAISKSTSYDTSGTQPGILLEYTGGSSITSVAYGGGGSYINLCTQYGNNTTELRFCNGYKAGQVGSSHAGIGKYYNYTYIRNNNTNDKKVYKITTGGTTSSDFTNFFLEKDMLDGTTISYDSTTGKISTVGSFVPTTRTINNKALSSDITLTAEDVGALPDDAALLKQYSDGLNEYGDLVNTNGVLSGFSNDNYASIPGIFFKPGHTIIVKFNYVTKTTARQYVLSSEGFLNIDINTNSTQLRTWDNSASTQVSIGSTMTSGSDYYLKIVLKDTGKDFYLTTDTSDWGTVTTVADTAYLTAEIPNNQVYLGLNITKSGSYWNSTIDSNYIEIYDEDNILIYSSKDNTDIATTSRLGVIKPDGTTLAVDKNGILSANIKSGIGTNLTANGNLNLLISEGDVIEATDTLPINTTRTYTYQKNNTAICSVEVNSTDDIYAINSFYIDKRYLIDPTDFEIVLYQILRWQGAKRNTYYNIIDIPNIVNLSWDIYDNVGKLHIYNYYTNTRIEIPDFSSPGMSLFDKAPEIKITLKSNVLTLSVNSSVIYTDDNFVTNTTITDNIKLEDITTYRNDVETLFTTLYLQKSYIKSGGQITWGLCGDNGVVKASDTTYGLVTKNHPMPGDSYETITVGASGATYNMTNTGWLCFDFGVKANNQYLEVSRTINNTNILLYRNQLYGTTNSSIACLIPVKKGDIIAVNYNVTGTKLMYFIPAVS